MEKLDELFPCLSMYSYVCTFMYVQKSQSTRTKYANKNYSMVFALMEEVKTFPWGYTYSRWYSYGTYARL